MPKWNGAIFSHSLREEYTNAANAMTLEQVGPAKHSLGTICEYYLL